MRTFRSLVIANGVYYVECSESNASYLFLVAMSALLSRKCLYRPFYIGQDACE